MKKIITLLIMCIFFANVFAQKITELSESTSAAGGSLMLIREGTSGNVLKKITKDNLLSGYTTTENVRDEIADSLNALRNAGVEGSNLYVKLLPDTVQKTTNFTLSLTEANRVVVCTEAASQVITIPANNSVAIPIGTTINFIQAGAGILVFKEAANVNLYSKKDSIATGGIWSWAALYKRGTNNWILYGDIID